MRSQSVRMSVLEFSPRQMVIPRCTDMDMDARLVDITLPHPHKFITGSNRSHTGVMATPVPIGQLDDPKARSITIIHQNRSPSVTHRRSIHVWDHVV